MRQLAYASVAQLSLAFGSLAACSHRTHDDGVADASSGGIVSTERAQSSVRTLDERFHTKLAAHRAIENANVALPALGDGALQISAAGVSLRISLEGASRKPGERAEGIVLYPGAGPNGSDLLHHVDADGVEDFVAFDKPLREVRYRLDLTGVSALRLIDGTLEALDASSAPRLHMRAPFLIDADGKHVAATVAVEGCNVDRDPRGPWGRTLVAPGAASCFVKLTWPELALPALLDPTWSAASGTMTTTRSWHTAEILATGKVLLAGGSYKAGAATTYLATSELYDPATKTFAATGSMTAARANHASALLADGKILVTGGQNATGILASAETYDSGSATWTATGPMTAARHRHSVLSLGSSGVLVAGGASSVEPLLSAELYFPSTRSFSATGAMTWPRRDFYLAPLPGGKVLAAFGYANKWPNVDLQQTEVFEPLTGTWAAGVDNYPGRSMAAGAVLKDGRVLFAGGYASGLSANITTASVFNPATATWTTGSALSVRRQWLTLTTMSNGAVLAAGGVVGTDSSIGTTFYSTAELWTGTGFTTSSIPSMSVARYAHTATALPDGTVLLAGGVNALGALGSAEIFSLSAIGETCSTGLMCTSGFCVDGVCCSSACTGTCQACSNALTGAANGNCSAVKAGIDPKDSCKDDGSPTCMKNGLCDGTGACASYPISTGCVAQPCTKGTDCATGYCYDGVCCNTICSGTCKACSAAKKGYSVDGLCEGIKDGTDPDSECGTMGSGVCSSDGVCNGVSACRVTTAGTTCAPAACVGTASAASASACTATGGCSPTTTTSCTPFLCDPASAKCRTTCGSDADCVPGLKCTAGSCAGKPNGATCAANTECTSGACADGVCCNVSCNGQCEACDNAGSAGTCTPVVGKPHGTRTQCSGSSSDPICANRCDGATRTSCRYPNSTTVCGGGTCVGTSSSTGGRCSGGGTCSSSGTRSCSPFVCDNATGGCKTSCTTSADCTSGFLCAGGTCTTTPAGTGCDDTKVINADGTRTDCFPYKCSGGRCGSSCSSDSTCAFGSLCEQQSRRCIVPNQDSDGCFGCALPATSSNSERLALGAFVVALLGSTLARRRRRSARATSGTAPLR